MSEPSNRWSLRLRRQAPPPALLRSPRPSLSYRAISYLLVFPVFRGLLRGCTAGNANMPNQGPLVVVANHGSHLDPPLLGHAIGRPVAFMAKEELFRVPLLGAIIRACGAYPVARGASDREALRIAASRLAEGWAVGVFLDGTRQRDGRVHAPLNGAALLAARAGAPLLPVAIINSHRALGPGQSQLRLVPVHIRIGQPIPPPLPAAVRIWMRPPAPARTRSTAFSTKAWFHHTADSLQPGTQPLCRPAPEVVAAQHPEHGPQPIAPDLAPTFRHAEVGTVHGHRREVDAPAAGHNPAHQQGPVHVVAAGDQQGMADAGLAQVIHQGGEVGQGVTGPVIQLHLVTGQALPLLEDPMGVLGISAATDHHRQAIPTGQGGGCQLPILIAPKHQDHLGRRWLGPPPAPRQPEQAGASQGRQPEATAAAPAAAAPHGGGPTGLVG